MSIGIGDTIKKLLLERKNNVEIGKSLNLNRHKVRRLIDDNGLTSIAAERQVIHHHCDLCGNEIRDNEKHNRSKCPSCVTKLRRYRTRLKAIGFLGGECSDCGWNKHPLGFDFHHIDPSAKDFEIADVSNKSWNSLMNELKKCVLLCAPCHRLRHAMSYMDNKFLAAVNNYGGTTK